MTTDGSVVPTLPRRSVSEVVFRLWPVTEQTSMLMRSKDFDQRTPYEHAPLRIVRSSTPIGHMRTSQATIATWAQDGRKYELFLESQSLSVTTIQEGQKTVTHHDVLVTAEGITSTETLVSDAVAGAWAEMQRRAGEVDRQVALEDAARQRRQASHLADLASPPSSVTVEESLGDPDLDGISH